MRLEGGVQPRTRTIEPNPLRFGFVSDNSSFELAMFSTQIRAPVSATPNVTKTLHIR